MAWLCPLDSVLLFKHSVENEATPPLHHTTELFVS
jgi:hypothetical protein